MNQVYVGGQLVGRRARRRRDFPDDGLDETTNLLSWQTFSPLVTPPVRRNDGSGHYSRQTTERFILLPSQRFVTVLAYKTGRKIAYLVPFHEEQGGNKSDAPLITSATLATYPVRQKEAADVLRQLNHQHDDKTNPDIDNNNEDEGEEMEDVPEVWTEEHVLLVGCHDGTVREFSLIELTDPVTYQQRRARMPTCGPYKLQGICLGPRRVSPICKDLSIIHLSSVEIKTQGTSGLVAYAIVAESNHVKDGDKEAVSEFSLRRILLTRHRTNEETPFDCVVLDRFQCRPSYKNVNNSPFSIETVFRDESIRFLSGQEHDHTSRQIVFVVVACSSLLTIYCDYLTTEGLFEEKLRFPPVAFHMPVSNALSAVTISTNRTDVACGHFAGEIRILCDVFTVVAQYYQTLSLLQGKSMGNIPHPKHPSKAVITRRVHWHSHPVASLAYQSTGSMVDPILHSGGHESVLVTWQLSRGTYRPADVLPRLSKGGIIHIDVVEGDDGGPSGILVASEDNTLQLFESHNRSLRWKFQGLACRSIHESSIETPMKTKVWNDPRGDASLLVLTGLPDAPGYIHWYDTKEQRVSGTVEVAPYNRVSKVARDDIPMPSPAITHCSFSKSGDDMVTVDITPTENTSIGAFMLHDGRAPVGTVSTIQFWSYGAPKRTGMNMPYQLIAAMTFPHGPENFVSALAISRDGQCCCSVSNGEKAIRIWHKTHTIEDDDDEDEDAMGRRRPLWLCRYRITSPSGFSNMNTRAEGVAFSTDGSILAVCYGNMITLWDHKEASFLTSLLHLEDDRAPVETIRFLPLESTLDMILTKSASGVALQSPFARCGSSQGWSWILPTEDRETVVTDAHCVLNQELVAISMYCRRTNQSRVVFVDVVTGDPANHVKGASDLVLEMTGGVLSMSSDDSAYFRNRKRPLRQIHKSFQVNVLTNEGELISLQADDAVESSTVVAHRPPLDFGLEGSKVPRLPDSMPLASQPKRPRTMVHQTHEEQVSQKLALANFGNLVSVDGSSSTPVPTVELPSLSGGFARAFIGRNLARNDKVSRE